MAAARPAAKTKPARKADAEHELFPGLMATLAGEDYFAAFKPAASAPAAAMQQQPAVHSSAPIDGRLAVDVYDDGEELVLKAPVAGIAPEDLDVFVHGDLLTVRGTRADCEPVASDAKAVLRECSWGAFSRTVILPSDIDPDSIAAALKNGVLTVRMKKRERNRKIPVRDLS